jgi:transcriptional regulator with XRE-family HTH domain
MGSGALGKRDLRHPASRQDADVRRLVTELTAARIALGLSQTDIAHRVGTSQRTVSQWENFRQEPKIVSVIAWGLAVGRVLVWEHVPAREGSAPFGHSAYTACP